MDTPENYHVEVNNRIPYYGDCNYTEERIRINTKKGDVVNTIIHENLHAHHPELSEEQVIKRSARVEGKMSLTEAATLLMTTAAKAEAKTGPGLNIRHTSASKVVSSNVT